MTTPTKKISILHAETQTLARIRLEELLSTQDTIIQYQSVSNRRDLLKNISSLMPDVLVFNYGEVVSFSIADLFKIRHDFPQIKILVLSCDNNHSRVKSIMQSGVSGYVFSNVDEQEIIDAVFAVSRGEVVISDEVLEVLINTHQASTNSLLKQSGLTTRQGEIIDLLTKGFTNKQVADNLELSHHTVHTHRRNIMKKLEVKTISELTLYAVKNGLINS